MRWQLCALTLIFMIVIGLMAPRNTEDRSSRNAQVTVSVLPSILGGDSIDARPNARERYQSEVSAAEAVQIALRRGEEIAETRSDPTLRETDTQDIAAAASAPAPDPAPAPAPEVTRTDNSVTSAEVAPAITDVVEATERQETPAVEIESTTPAVVPWRVTANRVNLRGGPSTNEPIVGRVSAGDALIPVSGLGSEWVEVERPSGETAWIFAEFLTQAEG